MNQFSAASLSRLNTCHPYLIILFRNVLNMVDITILEGHRSIERQRELYAQGRTSNGKIVTYVDGERVIGKHNYSPSHAVDVAPYPIDWNDKSRFEELAKIVKDEWAKLKAAGTVQGDLYWGGDFKKFKDSPHWELRGI